MPQSSQHDQLASRKAYVIVCRSDQIANSRLQIMAKKLLNANIYDTDKAEHGHYLRNYEQYFQPLLDQDVKLLELGVYKGGSLLLWRDYFEKGLIVGLDDSPVS